VEHHDIEHVTSNEDYIHISCVVTVLEDDYIEVPPPSVLRCICKSIAAQAPVDVVFHVGAECRVIRATRVNVEKVSCVMETMLYGPGVESSSKTVTIIDTHPDGFSLLVKYARDGSILEEADLGDTPANAWPYLLPIADMCQVEKDEVPLCVKDVGHGKRGNVTSFLRWKIQANCTQLQDKCMSLT
jgi:hypothetical protein